MFKTKILKGFVMGLGLAMALSTAAFAEGTNDEEMNIQITSVSEANDEEMKIQITSISEDAETLPPDAPVSYDGQETLIQPRGGADVIEPMPAADGSEVYEGDLYYIQDTAAEEDMPASELIDPRVYMTAAPVSAPADTTNQTAVMGAIAAAAVLLAGAVLVTRRIKTAKSN